MMLLRWARSLHVLVGRTTVRARLAVGTSVLWTGERSYTDPPEMREAIAHLAAECPEACGRLLVTVECPPAQLRTITHLPRVKARHLFAVVAQQTGRFFRRHGQNLVADAAWLGRGDAGVARAAAVDERLVEAIAEGARAAGLTLDAIAPADDRARLSLLPRSERDRRERGARGRTRTLALAAVAIWLTAGAGYLGALAWERRRIERELGALHEPLAIVRDARRELRDAEGVLNAVAVAEEQRPGALAMLTAVAKALPDSATLTSLTWRANGSGELRGVAWRATDVVVQLAKLGGLSDVRLGGAVVRAPTEGRAWEHLNILFGRNPKDGEVGN